jgi:hypothetical protein
MAPTRVLRLLWLAKRVTIIGLDRMVHFVIYENITRIDLPWDAWYFLYCRVTRFTLPATCDGNCKSVLVSDRTD